MKNYLLLSGLFSMLSLPVFAEVAIIVNPANTSTANAEDIQRMFLGKSKSFPGGADAQAFNLKDGSPVREAFNSGVLGKNENQVKAYCSQLVFTGKGTPPKEAADEDEMKKWVAANANAIGYIDAAKVDGTVKVLLKQ